MPVGRFRLRGAGSAGGHNGLKSIEAALQRQDYARLRIGVGLAPPGLEDLADFVLAPFEPDERRAIEELLDPMAEAVECWIERRRRARDEPLQPVSRPPWHARLD